MAEVEIESREKVKRLLKELFQFDMQDLDFGIYRIMNFKRKEIEKFIEDDLIKAAKEEFRKYAQVGMVDLQRKVDKLQVEIIRDFGGGTIDAQGNVKKHEDAPKIKEYLNRLKELGDAKLTQAQIDDVFNHIYEFFSRYYDKGDFLSKRRYGGREKYHVPYNGEEVFLHWATADQYYVKTGEYFKKYSFKAGRYSVNLVLKEAETRLNNQKTGNRYFLLQEEEILRLDEENRELDIHFNYRELTADEKRAYGTRNVQKKVNTRIVNRVFSKIGDKKVGNELRKIVGADGTTTLEKHIRRYVTRNTADYFIHKDLKSFLENELEFYLKNEVLDLDEIENMDERNIRLNKAKIRSIREIGNKIIDFLAQIEDFQKRLFKKKKFVLKTDYCITLDLVPEEFYKEIGKNTRQVAEWKELFKLDEVSVNTLQSTVGKKTLDEKFLKSQKYLVLDTKFFSQDFKDRLLEQFENLDVTISGIMIKSENWQALNLLREKYRNEIQCIYIDPPFNTGHSEILYKNEYRHSSWLSLMENRLSLSKDLLINGGLAGVAIDDYEGNRLKLLLDSIFQPENRIGFITVMHNPRGRSDDKFVATSHEYLLLYSNNISLAKTHNLPTPQEALKVYNKRDDISPYRELPFRRSGSNSRREDRPNLFYPIFYNPETKDFSLKKVNEKFVEILPRDSKGELRVWRWYPETTEKRFGDLVAKKRLRKYSIYVKDRIKYDRKPKSVWDASKYDASSHGTILLQRLFSDNVFSYPKSLYTVIDSLTVMTDSDSIIIDFFAGSGTTAHAVLELNRMDKGDRKYILVEIGDCFETVMKPRVQKIMYSQEWKDGLPTRNEEFSHMFKYMYLEQYEDTLNNITFRAMDKTIQETLDSFKDYFLRFMLDYETRESPTRLLIDKFNTPFDYKIKTVSGNQVKEETVDLVETFNYLLGLDIERLRALKDDERTYRVVFGKRNNKSIVVIWRNMKDLDLEKDKKFIEEKVLSGNAYDLIFINGDSYVKNARAIEPEFKKLMGA